MKEILYLEKITDIDKLLSDNTYLLLVFSASWCPPCIKMQPELENFVKETSKDILIVKINIDNTYENSIINNMISKISTIPTTIILKDKKIIDKKEGGLNKSEIDKLLTDNGL